MSLRNGIFRPADSSSRAAVWRKRSRTQADKDMPAISAASVNADFSDGLTRICTASVCKSPSSDASIFMSRSIADCTTNRKSFLLCIVRLHDISEGNRSLFFEISIQIREKRLSPRRAPRRSLLPLSPKRTQVRLKSLLSLSGSRQIYIEPTGVLRCKSAVCGLNGHRLYYIISLFKVTYKSTIQVSRNFHALFTKTLENSDTCD